MKKLATILAIAATLNAGTIGFTSFATSKHNDSGYNEQHDWIGLKYSYPMEKDLTFTSEIATFKNSYNDRTYVGVMGVSYLPLQYKDFKFGANASFGVQKGYCMDNFNTKACGSGDNDKSFIFIPSFEVAYKLSDLRNIGVNVTYNEGVMARFYFDLLEW